MASKRKSGGTRFSKGGGSWQGNALERSAQPEEIAPAFVFFASEADSSYIIGEVLTLFGGETAAA